MIDRYTYYALEFLEKVEPNSKKTMGEFVSEQLISNSTKMTNKILSLKLKVCPKRVCISTVGVRKDLYPKDPNNVPITDFFGSIRPTEFSSGRLNVTIPIM